MGIYVKGLLGAFSGKVGNVIGSSWRSIDYLRSLPKPSNKPATEKQRAQRAKFALAVEFLSPMREFINMGFNDKSQTKMTAFNLATNELLFKIEGEYPDFTIPYSDVKFSKGSLFNVRAVLATDLSGDHIITWPSSNSRMEGDDTDVVYAILYQPEKKDFFIFQNSTRADGECALNPEGLGTGIFHVWILTTSADGLKRSASKYLETLTI